MKNSFFEVAADLRSLGLLLTMLAISLGYHDVNAAPWIQLDSLGDSSGAVWRQADEKSIRRAEPWVTFQQRWVAGGSRLADQDSGLLEEETINCLTGAWGGTAYETTDPVTEKRVVATVTPFELEHGQSNSVKIDVDQPTPGLKKKILEFACGCPHQQPEHAAPPAGEARLRDIYDRLIKEQLVVVSYRLRFMEFESLAEAKAALRRLDSGESFAVVAQDLQPRAEFPGGDLGFHPEHSWTNRWRRIFRSLRIGSYTKEPVKNFSSYSLYFLEDRRQAPAASFENWRRQIEAYVQRTQSCGRTTP